MRLNAVTVGTSKPRELAGFYARLLGAEVGKADDDWADDDWVEVRVPGGFTLGFERERHFRRPVWPAEAGEQTASQHLDVEVDDLDEAVRHAVACGAVPAGVQPQEDVRVLFDPDGHPFCLFLG
ncbi:catechol 2,3-dioxygenase-like lactoylglutathione lyase family enzyme [Lentzea atacamensis]|uniref:Catechol 2,3-dioxygenase-like lactoylglutathione lyase family enzyme n=1 Tax=Lentzea atacamensis TaxID=531938 RepID=A0A316I1S9_9PSEU|nr:VOC family protein [Lentzea atacamensis]PWK87356.1 catechol 2,3-dioxygenase-like lactoylglutathione lyase family enzyme [Lentzea atacamensis]